MQQFIIQKFIDRGFVKSEIGYTYTKQINEYYSIFIEPDENHMDIFNSENGCNVVGSELFNLENWNSANCPMSIDTYIEHLIHTLIKEAAKRVFLLEMGIFLERAGFHHEGTKDVFVMMKFDQHTTTTVSKDEKSDFLIIHKKHDTNREERNKLKFSEIAPKYAFHNMEEFFHNYIQNK